MTVKDRCIEALKVMNDILEDYNVSIEDKKVLNDMLKGVFYDLSEAFANCRVLDRILEENNTEYELKRYMELLMEEQEAFPFNMPEE